jgi:hypothetical protein
MAILGGVPFGKSLEPPQEVPISDDEKKRREIIRYQHRRGVARVFGEYNPMTAGTD